MLSSLFQVLYLLLDVLWWVIIFQVVLSWLFAFNVLNAGSSGLQAFVRALDKITEPIYRPIRRMLPDFGGLDFAPLVVLILISVLKILISGAERSLIYGTV